MTLFRSSSANRGGGGACPVRAQRIRAGAAARAMPPLSPSSRKRRRGMSSTEKRVLVMVLTFRRSRECGGHEPLIIRRNSELCYNDLVEMPPDPIQAADIILVVEGNGDPRVL